MGKLLFLRCRLEALQLLDVGFGGASPPPAGRWRRDRRNRILRDGGVVMLRTRDRRLPVMFFETLELLLPTLEMPRQATEGSQE